MYIQKYIYLHHRNKTNTNNKKYKVMKSIALNTIRKTETTNAGNTIKLVIVKDTFRVFAYDSELNVLEVREVADLAKANLIFNNLVAKYSATETADILYQSGGTSHKWLYTNLDLKGRGIALSYVSDKGYKAYTATPLAFAKLQKAYSMKYAETIDVKAIA